VQLNVWRHGHSCQINFIHKLVEQKSDSIVVTLPVNVDIDIEEIQRFLKYLRYKELVSKSKATQEEIDRLPAGTRSSLSLQQHKNTIAGSGLTTGTYYPHVS